jgi:putative transcriptional regulator
MVGLIKKKEVITLHHHLFVARRENQMKQKDVAKLLNINHITYQRKESGKVSFTLEEAFKLANLFNTSVDDLFKNEKEVKQRA